MTDRGCRVTGCDRRHTARGLCDAHYRRERFATDPAFRENVGRSRKKTDAKRSADPAARARHAERERRRRQDPECRERINARERQRYADAGTQIRERQRLRMQSEFVWPEGMPTREAMYEAQDGRCAICRKPERWRYLSVDHCHGTGRVRGLLCSMCNTAIGKLGDNADGVRQALRYLEAAEAMEVG